MNIPQTQRQRYFSKRDAGAYVGVSHQTIHRLIQRGELKSYRIGQQVRVDIDELVDVMERNAGRG